MSLTDHFINSTLPADLEILVKPLGVPKVAKLRCAILTFLFILASCSDDNSPHISADNGMVAEGQVSAGSVSFDDASCSANDLPVAILLTNNSDNPTRRVSWTFAAFKENHSTDLASGDYAMSLGDPNRSTDRIIQPGETFKVCSSMPRLQGNDAPEELTYQVKVKVDADF